ncbi:parapinopsin-like [Tachysurus vachellii]|uniref:parapinopsin-like n=1 Tax=Tachysurus vachellii TaxID=175792 RepID=UPI00296AC6E3|nr:parapinopsin-like [Tachysurus vachellii]
MEQRAEEITEETPVEFSTVSTLLSPLGYGLLSFWMLIVTLLSVLCNTLVIAVMLRNHQLFFPTNVLILGLSVSDLLMTICGSSVSTVTNYFGQLFMGRKLCVFQGFTVNYFGLISLCTLTLMAYERYHIICKPMGAFKITLRRNAKGLLLVWIYCLFWATAPLLGWGSYGPEGVQTSCSLAWEERTWISYSFLIPYWFFCFFLPTWLIIYCYYHILISIKRLNQSVENQGGRSRQKEDRHAMCMVAAMIGSFFFCWLPYAIVSMLVILVPDISISPLLASMPAHLAKTSPAYNPIIFFLAKKKFRDMALEIISCGCYRPTLQISSSSTEADIVETGSKHLSPSSIQPEPAMTN